MIISTIDLVCFLWCFLNKSLSTDYKLKVFEFFGRVKTDFLSKLREFIFSWSLTGETDCYEMQPATSFFLKCVSFKQNELWNVYKLSNLDKECDK